MAAQQWVSGFSKTADDDGLVRVKIVDAYLATLPEKIRAKMPARFMCEKAYRKCKFPNAIAKEKAYRNLSNRNFVIPMQGWMFEALGWTVTQGPVKTDFNAPPEAHAKAAQVWSNQEVFAQTHPKGWALSWDWNPEIDDKAILAKVKQLAEDDESPMSVARSIVSSVVRSVASSVTGEGGSSGGGGAPEPAEFIVNGGFDTDTDWSKGTGWTIAAGVAAHAGADGQLNGTLVQALQIGNNYRVLFDITSPEQNALLVLTGDPGGNQTIGGISYANDPLATPNDISFTATRASTGIRFISSLFDSATVTLDNVSLIPD